MANTRSVIEPHTNPPATQIATTFKSIDILITIFYQAWKTTPFIYKCAFDGKIIIVLWNNINGRIYDILSLAVKGWSAIFFEERNAVKRARCQ